MRLPPVILSEQTMLVIAALLIMGGAVLGAILYALHQMEKKLPEHQRTPWVFLAFAVVAFAALLQPDVNRQFISAADKAVIASGLIPKAGIDLRECPKAHADMRGKAQAFTLSSSDTRPDVSGCSESAEAAQ